MTPLSRCALVNRERPLLRAVSVVRLLMLVGALTTLTLVQTHLRFMSRDMQIESRKLQTHRAKLLNRKKILVTQVEELKCYETVREYAVANLGLRECPPDRAAHVPVSPEVVTRWREIARDARRDTPEPAPCQEDILASVGGRMLALSSIASARSVETE